MQKKVAEELMSDIMKINSAINDVMLKIDDFGSEDDIKTLKHGLASTVLHVYKELMRPIIRQFPELDPDAEYLRKK